MLGLYRRSRTCCSLILSCRALSESDVDPLFSACGHPPSFLAMVSCAPAKMKPFSLRISSASWLLAST